MHTVKTFVLLCPFCFHCELPLDEVMFKRHMALHGVADAGPAKYGKYYHQGYVLPHICKYCNYRTVDLKVLQDHVKSTHPSPRTVAKSVSSPPPSRSSEREEGECSPSPETPGRNLFLATLGRENVPAPEVKVRLERIDVRGEQKKIRKAGRAERRRRKAEKKKEREARLRAEEELKKKAERKAAKKAAKKEARKAERRQAKQAKKAEREKVSRSPLERIEEEMETNSLSDASSKAPPTSPVANPLPRPVSEAELVEAINNIPQVEQFAEEMLEGELPADLQKMTLQELEQVVEV